MTEMVAQTRTWADPAHPDHQQLAAHPATAGFLPAITAVHERAVGMQLRLESKRRLREIIVEQRRIDGLHDALVRAIWYRLESERHLALDAERAQQFVDLRDALLPEGLYTVRLPYLQEVGHAEMVASQITTEMQQLLHLLPTDRGDLFSAVEEWFAAADQLGQLDHERATLEGGRTARGVNLEIRRQWIHVVELCRQAMALYPENLALVELSSRIERAEALALRRARERGGDDGGLDGDLADGGSGLDDGDDGLDDGALDLNGDDPGLDSGDALLDGAATIDVLAARRGSENRAEEAISDAAHSAGPPSASDTADAALAPTLASA